MELSWSTTTIDKIEQLGNIEFSFEKLSKKYGTFRSYSNGTDRLGRKIYRNRLGVQTDYGDIEVTLWCILVHTLIEQHNERKLFNHLKVWVIKSNQWLTNKAEVEIEALELHARRIFDDPCWHGYVEFNEKYRPEVLQGIELVWVVNQVENTPQQITRVRMERDNAADFTKNTCGKWIELKNYDGGTNIEN